MSYMQQKNPHTGFWEKVPEPKVASVGAVITYAMISLGGFAGLIVGQDITATPAAFWMTTYWCILVAFGGLAGAIAVLPGLYWLERIAITACGFGLVIFIVAMGYALHEGMVRNAGSVVPVMGFMLALLANIVITRLSRVRYGVRDPERYSTYRPASQ